MGTQDFSGRPTATPFPLLPPSREQIVDRAENCLRHNPYLANKNVQCDFHEGVLTLRGCLPTYYLRQLAQESLGPVFGILRIVNEIEIMGGAR